MSTTIFDRGDTVLVSYPAAQGETVHQRPAMVLHNVLAKDNAVALVPITPDPIHLSPSILVQQGSYEAARLGLITSGYLNACTEVVVDRKHVQRRIGKCPWRLMEEFLALQRRPIRQWENGEADRFVTAQLPSDL